VTDVKELTTEEIAELTKAYSLFLEAYRADGSKALIHPLDYEDADGDRLLHVAALRGDLPTVKRLLDAGENVNAVGDMGLTPAHYAAGQQHKEIFDLLTRHGADLTVVDEFGKTPPERWASFEEAKD
jgi:ankyrin repeat protein